MDIRVTSPGAFRERGRSVELGVCAGLPRQLSVVGFLGVWTILLPLSKELESAAGLA